MERFERALKPSVIKGRSFVALTFRNDQGSLSRRTYSLALLVAQHFLPHDATGRMTVGFKDGNKLNVHADNLFWQDLRKPLPQRVARKLKHVIVQANAQFATPASTQHSFSNPATTPAAATKAQLAPVAVPRAAQAAPTDKASAWMASLNDDELVAQAKREATPPVDTSAILAIMREFDDGPSEPVTPPAKEPVWARWGSEAAMHAAFMAGEGMIGPDELDLSPEEEAVLEARRREVESQAHRGPGRPRKDSRQG